MSIKGTITFFHDHGYSWAETWSMRTDSAEEGLQRLRRIAGARCNLLPRCVRVVHLLVKGKPKCKWAIKGNAGDFAHQRDTVVVKNGGRDAKRCLRCVAIEIYSAEDRLTGAGFQAFRNLNQVLNDCGVELAFSEPGERIDLQAWGRSYRVLKVVKKLTLKELKKLLGVEEAEKVWEQLKARRRRPQIVRCKIMFQLVRQVAGMHRTARCSAIGHEQRQFAGFSSGLVYFVQLVRVRILHSEKAAICAPRLFGIVHDPLSGFRGPPLAAPRPEKTPARQGPLGRSVSNPPGRPAGLIVGAVGLVRKWCKRLRMKTASESNGGRAGLAG